MRKQYKISSTNHIRSMLEFEKKQRIGLDLIYNLVEAKLLYQVVKVYFGIPQDNLIWNSYD